VSQRVLAAGGAWSCLLVALSLLLGWHTVLSPRLPCFLAGAIQCTMQGSPAGVAMAGINTSGLWPSPRQPGARKSVDIR
jgi:hypothetical protein